ncbi:hypothetical protein VP01_11727g1, partial [Puccinia sorghi]
VINAMLHDEFVKFQEQISRQIHKQNCQLLGHFKEIQFTQADWMQIKDLNDELKPFNFLTKEMEGDEPTNAFVLANYYQTIKDLKNKEADGSQENSFHPMYHKMITKLEEYQEEVLEYFLLISGQKENNLHGHFWRRISTSERHKKRRPDNIEELEKDSPKVDNNNIFE